MQVERMQAGSGIYLPEKNDRLIKKVKKTLTDNAVDSETESRDPKKRDHDQELEAENRESDTDGSASMAESKSEVSVHSLDIEA